MLKRHTGLSAILLCCTMASAQAATTSYSSQAAFLAALSGPVTTYDFDSSTAGTVINQGDTINGATFTYNLRLPGNPKILIDNSFATTSVANYLGTDDSSGAFVGGDEFTITFDETMYAIGMYVISDALIFDNDFTITTSNSQSASNSAAADVTLSDGDAYFIGLIEDDFSQGFDSITLSSLDAGYLFNVDDISVAPVPVPAAVWLFGSGLLCLVGFSRKKTRHS